MTGLTMQTGRIVPVAPILVAAVTGFLLGVWMTWLFHAPLAIVETAAPAAIQSDGSIVAARAPNAVKPKQVIPKGAEPVRVARVAVKPRPVPTAPAGCDCEPVVVDTTLVREKTGGSRLLVSTAGGQLIDAIDSPLVPDVVARNAPWAAGATYGTGGRVGAFIDRDMGPIRLGAEVDQASGESWQARVRVGWRF